MATPRTATEQVDLEATLQSILEGAVQALCGDAGVIAIWNDAEHRFAVSASYGLDDDTLNQLRPLLSEAAPDLATSKEGFSHLSRLFPDMALPLSNKGLLQDPILVLPLKLGDNSIGLIYILRPTNAAAFSILDQPVLAAFAQQASLTIQNTKLAYLLAEEKRRVEDILESSAEGIMSVDANYQITSFNLALEKMTGYSREEVLGKNCFNALNFRNEKGEIYPELPFNMKSKEGTSRFEQEGRIRTRDGRDLDVVLIYSVSRSQEANSVNAVINVRDISQLKELENLRETFLSMLGHELQTPISIIKSYASTLASPESQWNEETWRQSVSIIEEETDRLSKVVDKLLLASRISAGSLVLEKEAVELSSLVRRIVQRLQLLTDKHTFQMDFQPENPVVYADETLLEEVLVNLIENAIKYSPQGGKITISSKIEDNMIRVSVADEGIGIKPEDMDRIFSRFSQTDIGLRRRFKGVGLGLHICKSIIEAHNGRIEVQSEPNKGSQFSFTLPWDPELQY